MTSEGGSDRNSKKTIVRSTQPTKSIGLVSVYLFEFVRLGISRLEKQWRTLDHFRNIFTPSWSVLELSGDTLEASRACFEQSSSRFGTVFGLVKTLISLHTCIENHV